MIVIPDRTYTIEEFVVWAARQSSGRFELVDGRILAMAPERLRHTETKLRVVNALAAAIRQAGLACQAFIDGPTVRIDDRKGREPDAFVVCEAIDDWDAMIIDDPIIVAEVASPSTVDTDTMDKVAEYFSIASVQHYLIVHPGKRLVIHHLRQGSGPILTEIVQAGDELKLDPPGMVVPVGEMLRTASA